MLGIMPLGEHNQMGWTRAAQEVHRHGRSISQEASRISHDLTRESGQGAFGTGGSMGCRSTRAKASSSRNRRHGQQDGPHHLGCADTKRTLPKPECRIGA